MRVTETWYCNHCVCLPRDNGDSFVLDPVVPYTLTPLFLVFDYPYTGELQVTAEYAIDEYALTPSTINTFTQLKRLGVTYISGLQDISVSFKGEGEETTTSFFRRVTSTPYAELINTRVVNESGTGHYALYAVGGVDSFPANREWYPVTWRLVDSISELELLTPGQEHNLVGFIRYPVDGRARLVSDGVITLNTQLINDDYFVDLTSPNYLTTTPPTTTSVVRVGKGVSSYTLQLDIEVLVYGNS